MVPEVRGGIDGLALALHRDQQPSRLPRSFLYRDVGHTPEVEAVLRKAWGNLPRTLDDFMSRSYVLHPGYGGATAASPSAHFSSGTSKFDRKQAQLNVAGADVAARHILGA